MGVLLDWGGLTDWGGGREVGSGFQLAAGAHMAKGGVGGAFGLWPKVGACMAKRAFGHPPTYGRAAPLAMRWPKRPPFAGHHKTKSGRGGPSMGQRAPTPPFFGVEREALWKKSGKIWAKHTPLCAYLYRMVWLSPQQVREVVREVMGWKMHPKTLCTWVRAGKLRGYSPGGRRVFYRIEEVAALVGLTPDQVREIVQKEKGGQP